MRQLILLPILSLFLLAGCQNESTSKKKTEKQPKQITILKADELAAAMKTTEVLNVQLSGTIIEVCQTSGCWMDIDMGNLQRVLVTFPESVFVTPKDAVGKQATVQGLASKIIIPVRRLQLQAADEGASEDEINAITEPVTEYSIEATKVVVQL